MADGFRSERRARSLPLFSNEENWGNGSESDGGATAAHRGLFGVLRQGVPDRAGSLRRAFRDITPSCGGACGPWAHWIWPWTRRRGVGGRRCWIWPWWPSSTVVTSHRHLSSKPRWPHAYWPGLEVVPRWRHSTGPGCRIVSPRWPSTRRATARCHWFQPGRSPMRWCSWTVTGCCAWRSPTSTPGLHHWLHAGGGHRGRFASGAGDRGAGPVELRAGPR